MRTMIAGNWKMNGIKACLPEIEKVCAYVQEHQPGADIVICPPSTLIERAAQVSAGRIAIGGQDCHTETSGAFTGELSAEMLRDAGASVVVVGHSERRRYRGENDEIVAAKAVAAQRAGLMPIVCIGETEAEHANGTALSVCSKQLRGSIPRNVKSNAIAIAYEPVWAIGSGRTPGTRDIREIHQHLRDCVRAHLGPDGETVRILYGGSVNRANAREIFALPGVDGALVGGASLLATDFTAIIGGVTAKTRDL